MTVRKRDSDVVARPYLSETALDTLESPFSNIARAPDIAEKVDPGFVSYAVKVCKLPIEIVQNGLATTWPWL